MSGIGSVIDATECRGKQIIQIRRTALGIIDDWSHFPEQGDKCRV